MEKRIDGTVTKYDERHHFWTDKAITQFGTTSNLFFIISAGFLAYLVGKPQMEYAFNISFQKSFNPSNLIFAISIILSLLSVFASGMTVLSRLHDLRLTRHTLWIRKKSYMKWNRSFPDNHVKLGTKTLKQEFKCFFFTIVTKKYFITDNDISNWEVLENKFQKLRQQNLLLGRFSWRCLNYQIILIVFSFFLFVISYLT